MTVKDILDHAGISVEELLKAQAGVPAIGNDLAVGYTLDAMDGGEITIKWSPLRNAGKGGVH